MTRRRTKPFLSLYVHTPKQIHCFIGIELTFIMLRFGDTTLVHGPVGVQIHESGNARSCRACVGVEPGGLYREALPVSRGRGGVHAAPSLDRPHLRLPAVRPCRTRRKKRGMNHASTQ